MDDKKSSPRADAKPRILSGIQVTEMPHIGNFIGAISNWQAMQEDYEAIFFLANLHTLTVRQNPESLRTRTLETYALMLASGLSPKKSTLFIQSELVAHSYAAWLLMCETPFGDLSRMTQFKDKSEKNKDNINAGLFTYPVLMAADILLYKPDLVPVGDDQTQHVELAQAIARRFNHFHGDTFKIPKAYSPKIGARIMSLKNPLKKMSKSDDDKKATVFMLDSKDDIIKKFKSAVTDSGEGIVYKEGKDGINNLMAIYSSVSGKTFADIEAEFAGAGYGSFKTAVGEAVADKFAPIKSEYERLLSAPDYLIKTSREGAERASKIADASVKQMKDKLGLI